MSTIGKGRKIGGNSFNWFNSDLQGIPFRNFISHTSKFNTPSKTSSTCLSNKKRQKKLVSKFIKVDFYSIFFLPLKKDTGCRIVYNFVNVNVADVFPFPFLHVRFLDAGGARSDRSLSLGQHVASLRHAVEFGLHQPTFGSTKTNWPFTGIGRHGWKHLRRGDDDQNEMVVGDCGFWWISNSSISSTRLENGHFKQRIQFYFCQSWPSFAIDGRICPQPSKCYHVSIRFTWKQSHQWNYAVGTAVWTTQQHLPNPFANHTHQNWLPQYFNLRSGRSNFPGSCHALRWASLDQADFGTSFEEQSNFTLAGWFHNDFMPGPDCICPRENSFRWFIGVWHQWFDWFGQIQCNYQVSRHFHGWSAWFG